MDHHRAETSWAGNHTIRMVGTVGLLTLLMPAVSMTQSTGAVNAERDQRHESAATEPTAFAPPRTAWGDPDLQGIWPSGSLITVPFERDPALGERTVLTEAEAAARANQMLAGIEAPGRVAPPGHWLEMAAGPPIASLIVDPPDGRLPPLTTDGERRAQEWREKSGAEYPYAGPEDLRPYDRCISRGVLGSAFPNIYSTGMQILQTPGFVVIRHEMIHETRVIPLDGYSHLPDAIRSYMGDARGHWEGDTLVVDTRNFNGATGSYWRNGDGNPTSPALHLVERFHLSGPDTLEYEVRIDDPDTWPRPWTVAFPLPRDDSYAIYEYACHEGNYAMEHILSAARARD